MNNTTDTFRRQPALSVALLSLWLSACGGGGGSAGGAATPPPPPPAPIALCTPSGGVPSDPTAPQVTLTLSNGAGVSGDVVVTLNPASAPITTANYLRYVNDGFYDGTVFHRHSPGFVLQGGGYAGPLTTSTAMPTEKLTRAPIVLEDNTGLSNVCLTVAMARLGPPAGPDTATSQFFVNLASNTALDRTAIARGYAVFGSVTSGRDVLVAATSATCSAWAFLPAGDCLPVPNITITRARQTR